jgi:hypothetical protein
MHDLVTFNLWNRSLWSHNQFIETKFQFRDYVLWFPKVVFKHAPKFQRQWFGPYHIQYYLFNNTILLVTIDKFDLNLVLVNINKLKPYRFIKEKTLQLVLVKLGDLVIDELVQAKELVPLPIEPKDFQLIEFELVSNHSTLNNIETTYVLVLHYHNLPILDNNVMVSNDPNDMFGKALINFYLLGVSNPKGCVHS